MSACSSREAFDVLVIGAGPSGSVAAGQLAIGGARVLLVDRAKFPRDKVCGCCVNAAAVNVLAAIGLGDIFKRHHAIPLQRFDWRRGRRVVQLPLTGGYSLARSTLDAALIEHAVSVGAEFRDQTSAIHTTIIRDTRSVLLRQDGYESNVVAGCVIDASGLGSALAGLEPSIQTTIEPQSHMGLSAVVPACPKAIEPGVIYMADGPHGYVGVVRLESNRMDIAAAVSPTFLRSQPNVAAAIETMFSQADFEGIADLDQLTWQGTPLMTRRRSPPAAERLLLVGDAAGYVEPFTGEGIAWAVATGVAVAPHARAMMQGDVTRAAQAWQADYRRLLHARQKRCRQLTHMLRGRFAPAGVMQLLRLFPSLASPVVRSMSRSFTLPKTTLSPTNPPVHPQATPEGERP